MEKIQSLVYILYVYEGDTLLKSYLNPRINIQVCTTIAKREELDD